MCIGLGMEGWLGENGGSTSRPLPDHAHLGACRAEAPPLLHFRQPTQTIAVCGQNRRISAVVQGESWLRCLQDVKWSLAVG